MLTGFLRCGDAAEAMTRKNIAALATAVNDALRRAIDRTSGREDELRERLDQAKAEQKRWLDAIGSGGEAFTAVRDRLAAVEQEIAGLTADLERAKFEKRAVRAPTAIDPRDLRSYLRGLRRAIKTDVPTAKTMILGLLDGDLVLTPANGSEPATVAGRIDPARVVGFAIENCGGRI